MFLGLKIVNSFFHGKEMSTVRGSAIWTSPFIIILMIDKSIKLKKSFSVVMLGFLAMLLGCTGTSKKSTNSESLETVYPSDISSVFNHFNLILGDGSNTGQPIDFNHEDFFFTAKDGNTDWIVYKTPNAGNTHGTSNNTKTELAQLKKWSAMSEAKMTATCKIMNVIA